MDRRSDEFVRPIDPIILIILYGHSRIQMTSTGLSSFDWLAPNQTRVLLNVVLTTDWIVFNIDKFGFYRVNYDEFNWQLLINGLKTDVLRSQLSHVHNSSAMHSI